KPRSASGQKCPDGGRRCSSASAASTGSAPDQKAIPSAQERTATVNEAPTSAPRMRTSASTAVEIASKPSSRPTPAARIAITISGGRSDSAVPSASSNAFPKESSGLRVAARNPSRTARRAGNMPRTSTAPHPGRKGAWRGSLRGTYLQFYSPFRGRESMAEPIVLPPAEIPSSVLVVDDEPIVLQLFSRVLKEKGLRARTAPSA